MKEKNQRLINEVNKLIYNVLTKEGRITLPEVGTLEVNREEGSVHFSAQECESSIVDIISMRGDCTPKQASKVYAKWLDQVREGDKVEIEGIAIISGEQVTTTPEMEKRLKPEPEMSDAAQGEASPRKYEYKKSESKAWIWIVGGLAAVVAIVAVVCTSNSNSEQVESAVVAEAVEVVETAADEVVPVEPEPEPESILEEEVVEVSKPIIKETKLKSSARFATSDVAIEAFKSTIESSVDQTRYRVACGVLLSRVNAGRLVLDIKNLAKTETITPAIYSRNDGYMVVAFESESFRACVDFIQDNDEQLYDSMWIYDDQKM